MTHDANGNVTSITPPGRPAHGFQYTPINLESEYIPPQTSPPIPEPRTLFAYNADGQMTQITRPDGGTITYTYDTVNDTGQLKTKTLPGSQGTLQYSYYPETATSGAGQLQNIIAPDGGVLGYTYYGQLPFQESWDGSAVSGGGVSGSKKGIKTPMFHKCRRLDQVERSHGGHL